MTPVHSAVVDTAADPMLSVDITKVRFRAHTTVTHQAPWLSLTAMQENGVDVVQAIGHWADPRPFSEQITTNALDCAKRLLAVLASPAAGQCLRDLNRSVLFTLALPAWETRVMFDYDGGVGVAHCAAVTEAVMTPGVAAVTMLGSILNANACGDTPPDFMYHVNELVDYYYLDIPLAPVVKPS